jgi:MinD superfamily P-loop ATPase
MERKVVCDTDVDAANLHLLLSPRVAETRDFFGSERAAVDRGKCTRCRRCVEACRFGAINESFQVRPGHCEGCGACAAVCPNNASFLQGYPAGQMLSMIDAAVEGAC